MKSLLKNVLFGTLILSHLQAFAGVPTVALANIPLYAGGGTLHPNLLLDLSVEFPTVKAAYTNSNDYNKAVEYLGYFNAKKCYVNGSQKLFLLDQNKKALNRTVWVSDQTNGYFSVSRDADANHECPANGGFFSGNFMNWAASSSIDMLRLALTGGDRIVDSTTQTVLQRAYLYPGIYNSGNFQKKYIDGSGNMSAPSAVTPFSSATIYILNCDNKIVFSDVSASGGCGTKRTLPNNDWTKDNQLDVTTDRVLGEYLARVQVCDTAEATARTDLCQQYPNGSYKPVGQMQRNQNTVRFGAFGYLMDNSESRYGGVLRAPLKYVGSKQYRAVNSFVEETNDRPEWDANTGIFGANPENDALGASGVINYLNQFGRTDPSAPGTYKTYDPISELYYESIRYLQGKQPTPDAYSGMTDAMKNKFPVITTWTDPIEASCQKNYIITIGDVNTWDDLYIPGNTRTNSYRNARSADTADATWPAFNVMNQTSTVAAMESTTTYGNSAPNSSLSNLANANTGVGNATFYVAGTAYWAHTNDIRFDKRVRVTSFSIDVDEGGNGTLDSSPRGVKPRQSSLYLAAKYGSFVDKNVDANPFKTFDTDNKTVITNNTEWTGTATGTDPSNYFLASNPKQMITAINNIFATLSSNAGTLSGVGISSTSNKDNPYVYEPGFDGNRWSGHLFKKSATAAATDLPVWDAGLILSGDPTNNVAVTAPASRKIYTSKVAADGSLSTVEFSWGSNGTNFSTANQIALNTNPHTNVVDNRASDRIDFLRGVRTLELGKVDPVTKIDPGIFRTRNDKTGAFGDIVNSAPLFYGVPAQNISDAGYSTFYANNASRQKAVYVGANDGMLHAFNADDGTELFAYIPNILIPKLNQLTDPYYQHTAYVDGKMTIREAQVSGSWKTVLVSGMGSGAKGVFTLDVTNPTNFVGNGGALWEFSDANDPDMGYILNPPVIGKFLTGTSGTTPIYGNFVVVSSGYNNYDPNSTATTAGAGALFILSLDKKPGDPWVKGSNYFKLSTPISDSTKANGLATPTIVLDSNGAVQYAYAGDLQGNLWRFDFTLGNISVAKSPTKSVFTAITPVTNKPQPITVQPRVIFAPGGGYIVYFGTGKYLESYDTLPANYDVSSYYAIFDTTADADRVTSRAQLEPRTLNVSGGGFTLTGNSFTYGTVSPSKKGWYFDFNNSSTTGERIITTTAIAGTTLYFNSLILSSDPCSSGTGRKYQLDSLTGLTGVDSSGNAIVTGTLSTIGLPTSPLVIITSTTVTDRNSVGSRRIVTKNNIRTSGTGGASGSSENATAQDTIQRGGRISWRELQNWQELQKEANK
ncbi:PilC/PilY family type IV pilus protein [Undibacterium sp. 5I1]|uniref:pilus assembly protein n=1 Tax=unclassified Undibacterium TaxID=2630295 RepID=UPI002AB49BCB|nr:MULTISPECIES: PilC/PilY family type IV pilus protein [unclassified Undibacterium]MDY7537339.1 PilC/PilY family type IV pilus protein [Undibacterium sp. 5I1]MEB0233084.1 PilC/PilY family type IV pilus protein [Undibacterium sp. 10I3]MEB0259837.1 PilC/PilY family type IV pilus protein [Undibacterium sp. 5I1]